MPDPVHDDPSKQCLLTGVRVEASCDKGTGWPHITDRAPPSHTVAMLGVSTDKGSGGVAARWATWVFPEPLQPRINPVEHDKAGLGS